MRSSFTVLLLLAGLVPAGARAHEVLHDVERGRAVAVRVYESDGEALADAPFEVFSPSTPGAAYLAGRTDRAGWLAFVPDAPGRWRVKVVEAGGHGLDTTVEVAQAGAAAQGGARAGGGAAFVLRPLLGAAVIAAVFGALVLLARRRSTSG
ncbi:MULTISPECIES: hypothetical protein [unclassified Anaeromyxobacter]|uniref:hypothetical protein n=1 Tax=unclassified Anaeromyxobacter TaxID=2620896 RepID=UPI001F57C62D|nr:MULTISPECIES: hypothetical protein [unclassified Anaeromyxobacter]